MADPACSPSDPGRLPHFYPEMYRMMSVPGTRPEHQTQAPTAGRRDGLANSGETLGQNPSIVLTQPCWTPGEGLASHLEGSTPSWEMTPKRTHEGHPLWGGMKAGGSGPVQDLPATHSVPSREGCLQDKKALAQRAGWHRKDLHLETAELRPFAQFCTISQFHSQSSAEGHTPK